MKKRVVGFTGQSASEVILDGAKLVPAKTTKSSAKIFVWHCPGLGENRILMSLRDAQRLGVRVVGIPITFPRQKEEFIDADQQLTEENKGPTGEEQHSDEIVRQIQEFLGMKYLPKGRVTAIIVLSFFFFDFKAFAVYLNKQLLFFIRREQRTKSFFISLKSEVLHNSDRSIKWFIKLFFYFILKFNLFL